MDLRKHARGKPCMVRVEGVCNGNPETTVLAHLNGGGMGMKHDDLHGAWCCSDCHDWVDFRTNQPALSSSMRRLYLLEAVIRTQLMLLRDGVIKVLQP